MANYITTREAFFVSPGAKKCTVHTTVLYVRYMKQTSNMKTSFEYNYIGKTPWRQNENENYSTNTPTITNNRGINTKPKHQAIAETWFQKNCFLGGNLVGHTNKILILLGSCNGRINTNRQKQF